MRRLLLAVFLLALCAPATALAAPVREGSVSAAATVFAWEGDAYGFNLVGEPCNTDHSCEDTLLHVRDAGNVTFKWKGTAPAGPAWLSLTVYKSDASGTEGDEVADAGQLGDEGSVAARLPAGTYLVRVAGLLTTVATYEATATLKPSAPPAAPAPPPAAAEPQPASEPKPSAKKKKCKGTSRKAKRRCKKKRRG